MHQLIFPVWMYPAGNKGTMLPDRTSQPGDHNTILNLFRQESRAAHLAGTRQRQNTFAQIWAKVCPMVAFPISWEYVVSHCKGGHDRPATANRPATASRPIACHIATGYPLFADTRHYYGTACSCLACGTDSVWQVTRSNISTLLCVPQFAD